MTDLQERLPSALADRYAVESEVGRGGMATVFLAEDLKHHRRVAIKVLHPELAAAVGTDRFLREIEIVAGLNHPHILPLHDSGEAEGLLYYVMPYVEGESLRQRLDREKQLPLEDSLRIAREVAAALEYAHAGGVVHRDIKPANILLSAGEAVVADFGIARAVEQAGGERVTQTGMTVGTPAYMSPEQASGEEADERSDIYALGCVLYEMLAGQAPLTGVTPQATRARRMTETPPPLHNVRASVPVQVDQVLGKAMDPVPADRYVTAREFAEALARAAEAKEEVAAKPGHRRLVLAAFVAVVAIIAAWQMLPRASGEARPSIAVLPFTDMSPEGDQEYFSDGISDELINLLTEIPGLRVTARTSSFSFKGQNLGIREIADRLNVAHVLEGSVRRAGNEVRITAQLIDARSDTHLWSENWDRSLDDIFAIQDEIAADVSEQLKVRLLGERPTVEDVNPEAYSLFLQARQLGRQGTAEGYEQSNALSLQALDLEPDYAAAWATLASNYSNQAAYALRPIDEGYQLARQAANRSLAIDPELAEAHARLGRIASGYDGDLAAAAQHLERALELAPANPDIIRDAAFLARELGRLDQATALQEFAVARDPVNAEGHLRLGLSYLYAGRLDEAIASSRTALSLSPGRIVAGYVMGQALLRKDQPEAALDAMQQETYDRARTLGLALAYHALGRGAKADAALAELMDKYEQELAYNIAHVLAFRGEADRAFEWLDRAVKYNDPGLALIAADIGFANIHEDPRWLPFLESIGKSPEQLAAIEFEVTLPE
jgi:serine/threonine-protein kinase